MAKTLTRIRLSPTQELAVDHGEGALLVVAGPGSGKTRVLTERVRRLLTEDTEHYRILSLTFTNKAANEMKERLSDIPDIGLRAFIGTLHSFCTEVLAQRGNAVGIEGLPQIFSTWEDRRLVLSRAVYEDPELRHELAMAGDHDAQRNRTDDWLRDILVLKSRLVDSEAIEDETERRIYDAYNAGLRASRAVDFDDLLLLTYRLFQERPKIAGFYRRLYKYICIDEAQDLNCAQYGVLRALCGEEFRNVMMVGDPKQSIYGFNTADPKYMDSFKEDFGAKVIELNENFRSSQEVVQAARGLNPDYEVEGILPVRGLVALTAAGDEEEEARGVVATLERLLENGHPDIEGQVTLERCAVLGRTRYTLLVIEGSLRERGWQYYKQLNAAHESESDLVKDFMLALRLVVNPADRLHLDMLRKRWHISDSAQVGNAEAGGNGAAIVRSLSAHTEQPRAEVVVASVEAMGGSDGQLGFLRAFETLETFANGREDEEKRAVWEDVKLLRGEWDRYLRSEVGNRSDLGSFLTHVALGTTQQPRQEGLCLLTVHSSKGLEFDVVFIVGMSEGTFPDYRALRTPTALAEEKRNAFVAVTRSKRLVYLSYPRVKMMPWGRASQQEPSRFLAEMGPLRSTD